MHRGLLHADLGSERRPVLGHGEDLEGSVTAGVTGWSGASSQTVNVTTGHSVRAPAIAVESNSDAYVVWSDKRSGTWQTYHQARNVSSWQVADVAVSGATTSATSPDIAVRSLSGSHSYIAWEEEIPAGNYEIALTSIHNDGAGALTPGGEANLSNTVHPSRTPAITHHAATPHEVDVVWAEDPVTLPEPHGAAAWLSCAVWVAWLHRRRNPRR